MKPKWLFMVVLLFALCMSAYGVEVIVPQISDVDLLAVHAGLRDALNAQDADQVASYFLDDAVYDFVAEPPPMEGKEAIAEFFAEIFLGLPDFHVEQRQRLASGNILITECTVTGTHLGELYQIPATGNSIQTMHLDVFEFEGDKIKHLTTYDNAASWLLQFGVMPVPEPFELVPSFTLPDPEATGLTPVEAAENAMVVWNAHDLETYAKLLHSDAEFLLAPLGVPLDRDAFIASQELYFLQYSDMHVEPTSIIDMGDGWVATPCVWTGTNDGPVIGFPGVITGKSLDLRGIWLSRYDADGLMTNMNVYWDDLTAQMQLGLFPPPTGPTQEELNKALSRRIYEEILNQQNLDLVDEVFAPDHVEHMPPNPDIQGPEGMKEWFAEVLVGFPDSQYTVEDQIAEGDLVAVRWSCAATHQGEAMGIPPTGTSVEMTGVCFLRAADGMFVEDWTNADFLGLMQQLGAVTPGREAPATYAWGASSEVTGEAGDPEANKAVVAQVVDGFWNGKNADVLDETHSADSIVHNPVIADPGDYELYKQVCLQYITVFPDMQVTVDDSIAEGDKVVVRWTCEATHQAELMGIPATGKAVTFTGITIYRLADGMIVETWWAWDALGLITQLTAPAPPTGGRCPLCDRLVEEVWHQGNLDVVDEVLTADYILHDPAGDIIGPEGFKQDVIATRTAFPDIHVTVDDIIIEGDKVAGRWTFTGTQQGELMGIPPTGSQVTVTGITIHRVAEGKFAEDWTFSDNLGMMQQLGVADAMGREDFSWGTPSEVTGEPGDPEANKAIIMQYAEEAWNQQNLDILDEIMSADFVNHEASANYLFPPGIEGHKQGMAMYFAAFPDLHNTPGELIAEGDMVVEPWTATATHQGELMGIPPTGKQVAWAGITIYRFADGKIVEAWWAWDTLGLMTQITPEEPVEPTEDYSNVFFLSLEQGLNMISLPLKPRSPYNARSFAEMLGATMVVRYDSDIGDFVAFIPCAPDDGFPIEGGQGYIVNVSKAAVIPFTGAAWTNNPPFEMAPPVQRTSAWAFVVGGWVLDGEGMSASDGGYTVTVKNMRNGAVAAETVGESGYFAAAYADLSRKAVVEAGDKVEVAVVGSSGRVVSGPFVHDITLDGIRDAVVKVQLRLGDIIPEKSALLQNYPNPFNPETWIPFHLKGEASVSIRILNLSGQLIRTLDLGHMEAGVYVSRTKAAYWDGKNEAGEEVSSGIYFYSISAGDFSATKKMIIRK